MNRKLRVLILGMGIAIVSSAQQLMAPVALDRASTGTLHVLDDKGQIFAVKDSGLGVGLRPLVTLPAGHRGIDIASADLNGRQLLFVTTVIFQASSQGGRGAILEYSADGKAVASWVLWRLVGGLDIDTSTRFAYVASAVSGELFRVSIDQPRASAAFVGEVRGATALGPLVIDAAKQRLYVADVSSGKLYSFDLASKRSTMIADGLGQPSALLLDKDSRSLFVADARGRRIWRIRLEHAVQRPNIFSRETEYRSPIGLAWGTGGALWVADFGANALFSVSTAGRVTGRVR